MSSSATDQNLVARCLRGESSAWAELFRVNFRHAEQVALAPPFRFTTHEAEDIAQETMIELARKLDEVENIPAFVGVIAHNKCVDRVRKKKPVLQTDLAGADGDGPDLDQLAAVTPLPLESANDELLTLLTGALESLGDSCRMLLHHRFFDELSYKDIAARLAIPNAQVGVYLARCLNRLRAQIEKRPDVWKELAALLG